jgi:hypothetical protein
MDAHETRLSGELVASGDYEQRLGSGEKPLCRPRGVLIGSPFENWQRGQQLPSREGKTAAMCQLAELARHFSIMRTVEARPAIPLSARWRFILAAPIAENGQASEERFNRIFR